MRKAAVIGLGVFLLVAALALWWADSKGLLPGYAQLRSYTDDASGLTDGTRVRLDGIPIGYLDHQTLTGSQDRRRRVQFDMQVKSSYLSKIPVDSVMGIVADNLLGDKSIDIVPGRSQEHVQPGSELQTVLAVDPNRIMAQAANDLQSLQDALKHVDVILSSVDAGQGSAGKLKRDWEANFGGMPSELQKLTKDFNNARGTYYKLFVNNDEIAKEVQATQNRLDDLMAALQPGQGTVASLQELRKDLDRTTQQFTQLKAAANARTGDLTGLQKRLDDLTAKFNAIIDKVNSGQGTLGQFAVNPQFSESLAGLSREFQGFAKDARANPKKFLTLRVTLF